MRVIKSSITKIISSVPFLLLCHHANHSVFSVFMKFDVIVFGV